MPKLFYRFRSIERLLGESKELENQSIYFAHSSQLNDPMEGYRDLFWSGDEIIWRNLFRHYLLCLDRLVVLCLIVGEEHNLSPRDLPVSGSEKDFPTMKYAQLFGDIKNAFFKLDSIEYFIKGIVGRTTPIRRDELKFYLKAIHPTALKVVFDHYIDKGLSPESNRIDYDLSTLRDRVVKNNFFEHMEKAFTGASRKGEKISRLFDSHSHIGDQVRLLAKYDSDSNAPTPNKEMLFMNFPNVYIERLEALVYPEWYTACFLLEPNNSSVWGHYGDNHTGVCLVFRAEGSTDDKFLTLTGITGWQGRREGSKATYGDLKHKFYEINYVDGAGEIDFFRSLGRLPMPTINSMWYCNELGKTSICSKDLYKSEDKWREEYWDDFYRDITKKSDDWKYENEYRLILSSMISDLSDPESRTQNYNFSSLDGIIFGIRTKEEDKLRILKIVNEKCAQSNRDDFRFHQAYYSHENRCIECYELDLLKRKSS